VTVGAEPTPPSVDAWLARFSTGSPPVGHAGAAVTIVLRSGDRDVEVLLIERTQRETDPASGQVALPGGHVADGDGSLEMTAVRELGEEVGLERSDLVGELRFIAIEHARRFGLNVAIFAAPLAPTSKAAFPRSTDEVAHVFWMPRWAIDRTQKVHRETGRGLIEVPATVFEGHVLWGFTRRVLRQFFEMTVEDDSVGPVFVPRLRASGADDPPRN
jgi:8-oxo-dGTP pyrophosphatase MutT (NUDIX family)